MLQIPTLILASFYTHLVKKGISPDRFQEYKKWLHFFLDFCEKYQVEGDNTQKLRKFINKLPKEFIHQWFFPMKTLTVAENGERRRYHLHESDLQRALPSKGKGLCI